MLRKEHDHIILASVGINVYIFFMNFINKRCETNLRSPPDVLLCLQLTSDSDTVDVGLSNNMARLISFRGFHSKPLTGYLNVMRKW